MSLGISGGHTSAYQKVAASITSSAISVSAGNGVVVGIGWLLSPTFVSIVDSLGSSFTQIETELTTDIIHSRCYYTPTLASGSASYTVTVTLSSAEKMEIFVQEITTSGAGILLDQSGRQNDAATPFVSTSETTTVNDEVLYAFGIADPGVSTDTWTAGNSFTMKDNNTDGNNHVTGAQGVRLVSATGTYNSSWTCATATTAEQWIATFSEVTVQPDGRKLVRTFLG